MRQAGIPDSMLDEKKSIANNLQVCYQYLAEKGSSEASRSLFHDTGLIMTRIEMLRVEQTQPVPGTNEAIDCLRAEGYSLAVLTRGSRHYTEAALKAARLEHYFAVAVCRDDYPDEEAKPNPISLERAADKLCLAKEECLLVGDHAMDLECARSAGSGFVGVLSGASDLSTWERFGDVTIIQDVSCLPDLLTRDCLLTDRKIDLPCGATSFHEKR
jgi:phosphoglycolate phosphatase